MVESKLGRLMNLVAALLAAERPRTRDELRAGLRGFYAESDESFRRTFERDKDELREMGIPIETLAVPATDPPETGYRIDPDRYRGSLPDLTTDELAALHLANRLVRLGDGIDEEPFWKLGGRPDSGAVDRLATLPDDPALPALMDAVVERRIVTFGYRGVTRVVEPHRLALRNGNWHLKGHDRTRGEVRQYRVDRIETDVDAGPSDGFDRPPRTADVEDRPAWRYGDDEPVTARLLVDAHHVPWVAGHLGEEAIVEERADGAVVVEESVCNRAAFRSFVLTFLEGAEVLGPDDLRREVVEWLEGLA